MCKKMKLAKNTITYDDQTARMARGSKYNSLFRSQPANRKNRSSCVAARRVKSMARAIALATNVALLLLIGTDINGA
jgi:hypothetical protein